VTIGYYPNNEDRYVAFKAGAAWERKRSERLVEALRIIKDSNHGMDCDLLANHVASLALKEYEGTKK
jgi:hypothetical protein